MSRTGYLVMPDSGNGPAVMVLHSWWGLNDFVRGVCDRLADEGYVALAPDLSDGRTTEDAEEAQMLLNDRDPNEVADIVLSASAILRSSNETPDAPIGVFGMAMGASWGLWVASRAATQIGAISILYGTQRIERLDVTASVQGHFADNDDLVDDDDRDLLEASLRIDDPDLAWYRYPRTSHGFFEPGANFDDAAADLVWQRSLSHFATRLDR